MKKVSNLSLLLGLSVLATATNVNAEVLNKSQSDSQLSNVSTLQSNLLALTACSIMAGSFLNGRLTTLGISSARLLGFGLVLSATSSVALVIVSVTGVPQLTTLMPLLIINTFCVGIIPPNAIFGAITLVPEASGIAAALVGFLQMLAGAISNALTGFLFDGHTAFAMSGVMALFAITALAIYTQCRSYQK